MGGGRWLLRSMEWEVSSPLSVGMTSVCEDPGRGREKVRREERGERCQRGRKKKGGKTGRKKEDSLHACVHTIMLYR